MHSARRTMHEAGSRNQEEAGEADRLEEEAEKAAKGRAGEGNDGQCCDVRDAGDVCGCRGMMGSWK